MMPDGRVERLENLATYFAIDADRRITYGDAATIDGMAAALVST